MAEIISNCEAKELQESKETQQIKHQERHDVAYSLKKVG